MRAHRARRRRARPRACARSCPRESQARGRELLRPDDRRLGSLETHFARDLLADADANAARDSAERALSIGEKHAPGFGDQRALAVCTIAQAHLALDQLDAARTRFDEATRPLQDAPISMTHLDIAAGLAAFAERHGELGEAAAITEKALRAATEALASDQLDKLAHLDGR